MTNKVWAFDVETVANTKRHGPDGGVYGRVVCFSLSNGTKTTLHSGKRLSRFLKLARERQYILVGHNISFDMISAICHTCPEAVRDVFLMYEKGRIRDTMIREKLALIEKNGFLKKDPSLADLAKKYLGVEMSKGEDTWRVRYGELLNVPIAEYPEEAKTYAMKDAEFTYRIFKAQPHCYSHGDESWQVIKDFCLGLMSDYGFATDVPAAHKLREQLEIDLQKDLQLCIEHKLVNKVFKCIDSLDGYFETYTPVRWKVTKKKPDGYWKGLKLQGWDGKTYQQDKGKLSLMVRDYFTAIQQPVPHTTKGLVSTSSDTLSFIDEPWAAAISRYQKASSLRAAVESYGYNPIRTQYNSLVATGRTASRNPNIQNLRRGNGVREIFVARPGHLIVDIDYPSLEMHTFAEVCASLLGHSDMGKELNEGKDLNTAMGAAILGIPYEEGAKLKKEGDKKFKTARNNGKVANYGGLGMQGPTSLVEYSRKSYGIVMTIDEAKQLQEAWHAKYSDPQRYFDYVKSKLTSERKQSKLVVKKPAVLGDDGKVLQPAVIEEEEYTVRQGPMKQLFVKRIRGNCFATEAANTMFQGLGADATLRAMWELTKRCWVLKKSALYGCRLLAFIHDQFLLEIPEDDRVKERATEMGDVMWEYANKLLPHHPMHRNKIEPAVTRRWRKDAEGFLQEDGNVKIWD